MADRLIDLGNGFWNIRGSFKVGVVLDIGTQASLVQLPTGRFVLLDSYVLTDDVRQQVMALTDGGKAVEAVLNLHPFHTVYCEATASQFPYARHYGTARHRRQVPGLDWQEQTTDDLALWTQYADVMDFSVPRGVDFISANSRVHFSSVLALHRPSGSVHVDDTLMYDALPGLLGRMTGPPRLGWHPTLSGALEKRRGAARAFFDWAVELGKSWHDAQHICTAHNGVLDLPSRDFQLRLIQALQRVEGKLVGHARKFG